MTALTQFMKHKAKGFKKISALSVLLATSACGIFGSDEPEIIFDTRLGPATKAQIRGLPRDLVADRENARHSSRTNAPADMAPEDDKNI